MSDFFIQIFDFFKKRKVLLWLLLATLVTLLALSASRISFVEDISSFLPNNANNKRINEAYQHIGAANKIVVTISPNSADADEDLLIDAALRFAEILQISDSAGHIKEMMCEVDHEKMTEVTRFITQNLPFFLEEEDYARIDTLIHPQNIEKQLKTDKELLLLPMNSFVREVILHDPLYFSQNALKNLEVFKQNDNYSIDNGFIFNQQGECIITITSQYPVSETANNRLLGHAIYKAAQQTMNEFDSEVKIAPFGATLISIANADQIKKDSILAGSVALVLILLLLFYFFRNFKSLFFIALSVLFGALFSLGIMVLFSPTVSIIAIGIASIIFGIAINYPLHFLAHNPHTETTKQTLREIVNPLLIGNITTVGAFLSLLFISSPAMHDLGLFSSLLLVGTIIFVLIFLPHFIPNTKRKRQEPKLNFGRLAEFSPERNQWIVFVFLLFTVILFFFSFGTKFETNLHAINYMTPELRAEMNKLIEENHGKERMLYVVAEGETTDEALQHYENEVLPYLNNHANESQIYRKEEKFAGDFNSGIGNFFPSKELQQQKIERWNQFWGNDDKSSKKDLFIANLKEAARKLGFKEDAFELFFENLHTAYQPVEFAYFAPIYNGLGENYFSISDDKTLIYTILNGENPEINTDHIFTFDDSSIAQKMVSALSDDFNNVLFICAFIVFAFLFFSFGRIELAIIAFIPLTVGWIWILGLMNIFDLKFNIVNIILATFIFGQGDDYTIFITEGLIYEYTYRRKMLASFKNSIILSASILFVAIGMLIFAQHPAMRSLAELTMVGMVSVVACAYLFPPLIFKWLVYKKDHNRIMPITLWNLAKTIFSFAVFLLCSLTMTLFGFVILTLCGKTRKHKLLYHKILFKSFKMMAALMPQVKCKIHNPNGENFEKPSIIICNHQSHLDLLYTLMLSPKIVVLTKEWVWNNPFYGRIVRYADFLPIEDEMEQQIEKLQELVNEGYSILVFPEGTRSEDCSVNRFHKGAFYLAEKLGLDILPVVIHGVGHFLPKKEFILRKGEVNIFIESRTTLKNNEGSLLELSKKARDFYKHRYLEISQQIETPDYFADTVLKNYLYKGEGIERVVRKSLKKHHNFREEIEKLPEEGEITLQNSGYGEFGLLAALVRKNLKINIIEENKEIYEIIRNCASIPKNLKIYHSTEELNHTKKTN